MEMKDEVEWHSHKEDNPPALLYTKGLENGGRLEQIKDGGGEGFMGHIEEKTNDENERFADLYGTEVPLNDSGTSKREGRNKNSAV